MDADDWISAGAAVLYLALGALLAFRGAKSPIGPPLAMLCVAFFAYDTLEVVRQLAGDPMWDWLNRAAAALVAPPTLFLVATFTGQRRALSVPLAIASAYFVVLALVCAAAVVVPSLRAFPTSDAWAIWMLAGMLPTFGAIPFVIARHARRASPEERARTQLFSLALALGIGGVTSELIAIAGAAAPRAAAFGICVSVLLLGALALRARIVERVSSLALINALAIASLAVVAHVVVLEWLGEQTVLLFFGTVAVTLTLLAALRPMVSVMTEERERARHLATLGRFSAQMGHDVKNPLAAIKGAAQYLAEESERGGTLREHREFVDLIVAQSDRLARVVEQYQRLARIEAVREPLDLAPLVRAVARAQRAAAGATGVEVVAAVGDQPVEAAVDRDLVESALENLVRNAREAIGDHAGKVVVALERRDKDVILRVTDDGPGMDARTRERAFDDFYTTKPTGSGLGLALVARVARAHGGRATIDSVAGRGTTIELVLPHGGAGPRISHP